MEALITIIHNIYDRKEGFTHSISFLYFDKTKVEGLRVGYNQIARLGNYAATTEYYDTLPRVFSLDTVTHKVNIKSNIINSTFIDYDSNNI